MNNFKMPILCNMNIPFGMPEKSIETVRIGNKNWCKRPITIMQNFTVKFIILTS